MRRPLVLHPFLFSLFPILALFAQNLEWITPSDVVRSMAISVLGAVVLLGLAWGLTRDLQRAALLATLGMLLFFSYGHVYGGLKSLGLGATVARHRYLAPSAAVLFITGGILVVRILRNPQALNRVLNYVSLALMVLPIFTVLSYSMGSPTRQADTEIQLAIKSGGKAPDIYYILVDGYGRADTLQAVYGFDNSPFLEYLESQGFYVADRSRANYSQTSLALASVLNMEHIENLVPEDQQGRNILWDLIQNSEVRRQLEGLGYEIVAFSTGLAGTEWRDADVYLAPEEIAGLGGANAFESALAQTTGLRLVIDGAVALPQLIPAIDYPYDMHRNRLVFTLQNLSSLPDGDRPRFVFAHLLLPHHPFVFNANGDPVTPKVPFSLDFPSERPTEEYILGYRDQIEYLNHELQRVLDLILGDSKDQPIVLIQADHGPDSNSGRQSYVQERMTILNAIRLPNGQDTLWPHITPVNTFRVVFNELFGGNYERLPDRAYFSEYEAPFEFIDVTGGVVPP